MQSPGQGAKQVIAAGDGVPLSHASYSPGIIHGSTLYVSGQAAFDPATGELISGDFRAQVARTLENLLRVAAAAGSSASDLIHINVHLANIDDFPVFDEVYRQYFSEPYATRMTVGSQLLAGLLIEVDGSFAVPDAADCGPSAG